PRHLPVKVLSRLFRRLMLELLLAAHDAGRLQFFGDHAHLADKTALKAYLAPLHRTKWFVYSKRPFAGPSCSARHPGSAGSRARWLARARRRWVSGSPPACEYRIAATRRPIVEGRT